MNAFRQFMETYTRVPDNEWEIICNAFECREYRRNEKILEEGRVCRYFWFLEEGLVRFFLLKDGEELTRYFTAAPYCFTSKDSFRKQIPATENIQALERSVVWRIPLKESNRLLSLPAWESFTRNFMHDVQTQLDELLLEILSLTAEERYLGIAERYPDLISRIPLKYLAGFIGIAPQSLSRIRRKHRKAK